MIEELIKNYESFPDSLIREILIQNNNNSTKLELIIICMNFNNDFKYEKVKIIFSEIKLFRFFEVENYSNTCVNSALVAINNGVIVFDFSPLIFDEGKLMENPDSDFIIKCKRVEFYKL